MNHILLSGSQVGIIRAQHQKSADTIYNGLPFFSPFVSCSMGWGGYLSLGGLVVGG